MSIIRVGRSLLTREAPVSKKILGIGLTIIGAALLFVPGIGTALGLGAISLGAGLGSIAVASLIGFGLEIAGSFLMGPSKPKGLSGAAMQTDRLTATLIPTTPRKTWLGITAGGTDVAYQAFTGTNQEYLEMIVIHASHEVHSIDELWLDNEQAESGGTIQGRYVGYLTVTKRTLGTNANGIAIDSNWTTSCTLTGCAYSHYKFKLTGNSDKVSSPFASGVTSRMTVRGKGAKVYDPRLDSTVAGGSGSHRANDQTTWAWDDNGSRNPALQELFYELGWKIGGKLAVGKGLPPARLDLASYAVAANHCDESVTLNGGGTEPRYRGDGIVSEGDDPSAVRDNLCATMNAVLRDAGGKLALTVIYNDLSTPVTPSGKSAFDQFDVQGQIQWDQTPDLSSSFNIARGRRIDPSDHALYQPVDLPEVALTSIDGIDRIDTSDYPFVQSNGQGQRLLKQRLQRNQYQGRLTFTGQPSFWGLNLGNVFPFTHPAYGWTAKLFRCASQQISRTGSAQIVAVEENAAIYAWANNEAAAVTPGTPVVYDPTNHPIIQGIGDAFNRYIDNPTQRLSFNYDYAGVAESGEFSRDIGFKLLDSAGQITSVITWSYLVMTGTVNGFTNASGSQSMSGAGTGTLTVSSLGADTSSVQIKALYGGRPYYLTIDLTRVQADPPITGGTGGGSGGTLVSKNSGFAGFTTTTFVDQMGGSPLHGTMPGGVTTANINVNLSARPAGSTTGSWTVELKVMRNISSVWTQIGSTQTASSDYTHFGGGEPDDWDVAPFLFSQADTGLTAGASYDWRVEMRITSGTRSHTVTGTVSVTA